MLLRSISVVACSLVLAAAAWAAGDTKQTAALSQPVFDALKSAQEAIETKNYAAGHAALNKLRAKSKLSAYETAQIWNLTAYAYYLQEQYPKAIDAYTKVLALPDIPEALVQSTLKTLSQLYFTVEDYRHALETVDKLTAAVAEPSADVYMLKGQAHFQLGQFEAALKPIKTALDKYEAAGKLPQENWLLLLRVCYYELQDFKHMTGVVKDLIRLYPKDQYILTLAGIYSELGDTRKQLALTESLYDSGRLRDTAQIVNLANLHMLHGAPYKAAKVLEKEMNGGHIDSSERNLRLLSQAWYQAREDELAIPPLQRAAEMAEDGELYIRLAQSFINLDRWQEAITAIESGLAKGGVKRVDTANLMLGMALMNLRKLKAAQSAFEVAASDKRSAPAARQWLAYVGSEISRGESLDQTLPEQQQREQDEILRNL